MNPMAPEQNVLNEQEIINLDQSHEATLDSTTGLAGDLSSTRFPSLTGLRSRIQVETQGEATISSRTAFVDLHNATAALGASPIAALQAAWAVVLSAYTAAEDHIIYTTIISSPASYTPGHLQEEKHHAIPTRVCLNNSQGWGQNTNGSILKRLTKSNAVALPRQEKSSKHGTMIALKGKERSGHGLESSDRLYKGEEYSVSLIAWPAKAGFLKLKLLFTKMVLNKTSALVTLKQLDDILAFILAHPSNPIVRSLGAIRPSLLSILNESPEQCTDLSTRPTYLHTQFEKFAKDSPHRIALDFREDIYRERSSDNTMWTYEQLDDKARTLATYLIHRFGQLADNVIPICMKRRPELYVAVLGILKAGAAWCPIDPAFPPRRRHDLIARTGAQMLIVAEQDISDGIEGIPHGIVTVDITCLQDTVANSSESPCPTMGSLAYLIWTSGTSGDPKGVPIHHEAAVTSMTALQSSIPTDIKGGVVRCLQFSQFTFDVFIQDIFYTWGLGGTIISSTREIMLGSFAELATRTNATHAHMTPAFAASVLRERCPTLEVITMIGEKLPQAVADNWSQNIRAFNTYGPAETTVVSCFRQFSTTDEVQSENIGFPLASVSAFVMRNGKPFMRQGIGELALGGPQLSKGYWQDPSRSSKSFLWNKHFSRHLYMTGDMVRQLYDGSLEFIGRTDDLIKVQGIRIELSEIGFCLRSCHPLIEQIEIQYLCRQDRPSKAIIAFLAAPTLGITKEPGQSITSEGAISIAQAALVSAQINLPGYMIPRGFLVLNSIPRTSSAKTDKSALKEIYSLIDLGRWEKSMTSSKNNVDEVSTWSPLESDLIATIAEVSGTAQESMSRGSDLRFIGIDSIGATRLAPIATARGISLSVTEILRCQNLGDLLQVTKTSRNVNLTAGYDMGPFHQKWYPRARETLKRSDLFVAPALPLQESLLSESMQNSNAYWSHVFLSLNAQVDIPRLHEAWVQVISHTEALRTGFIPLAAVLGHCDGASVDDSTFLQLIYENTAIDWICVESLDVDITTLSRERAHAVAESRQRSHFTDPLVAITIFEQPNHRTMMISIHHSVRDEASLKFVLEDVSKSYEEDGKDSKRRHQLRDALKVMLPTKAQSDRDAEFWSKALDDFITTEDAGTWPDLTGKNTRSEGPAAEIISHTRALKTSYKDLQVAANTFGASSVASIIRVAWGTLLLEYLETDSVVFAETWSSRIDDHILANVVGPLINVLPVPFRALGSVRQALIAQSSFQKESGAHRSIHAKAIRKFLGRSEHQVLYPAFFNFLPDLKEDDWNGSSLWKRDDTIVGLSVEHPLALNVAQATNGILELEISASRNVISSGHLAILALQVDAFVETILRSPDIPLAQLSLSVPKELLSVTSIEFSEEVRLAWSQNPTEWVDYYASLHPQWPAVQVFTSISNDECESQTWNFEELRSAYCVIAASIRHGGHVNRMMAVCLDRRIEAYAIILGILASGNTYLPIDEDLPSERKSFLLKDSTAAMLFTTRFLAQTFPGAPFGSRTVYVDDSAYVEQISPDDSNEVLLQSKASDNAYLLYTSGSTGIPKGVLVGRGNLCSFIEGLSEFICPLIPGMQELPGKGKYLGLASRAFDVHIAEMFLAWRQGLAAVTAPRMMLLDNLELALRQLKITHASFVPSLIDQAGLNPASLPDLHYLGVGGEKMSKSVIDTWASNENTALINAYGPTEMSIGCTAAEVTIDSNSRNVGRPYGNSVAHVLVPGSDRYTLRGVAGELCFTGDLVANGYLNRPDAKGFVENFNGERMYRTGDIVRLMADDALEYLRREDDQAKVRGQRVELGEISEAIRSSAVTTLGLARIDVTTMIAQHPKLSKVRVVSFVVLVPNLDTASGSPRRQSSAGDNDIARKMQAECRKILPAYMVPDLIIPITRLPLAPSSGKADLKRLKALFADLTVVDMVLSSSDRLHQPESSHRELTAAEKTVRSAVESTLAVDAAEILTNTNIFRLGLDSLSAISLAIRLQRVGYDCTVSSVLRNPTVAELAHLPRKGQSTGQPADTLTQTRSRLADLESRFGADRPRDLDGVAILAVKPCMPLQETLVANNRALYINHMMLKLLPNTDRARLYRAWAGVIADHEILRTCFQEFEDGFVQVVLQYDPAKSVPWVKIATVNTESACQIQQTISARNIISDMARNCPMRLTLLWSPTNNKDSILLFSIHHALYDRESISIVLEEVNLRYHSGTPSAHSPFDSMIGYVCSQDLGTAKTFWQGYLAYYRPVSFTDRANTTDVEIQNYHFLTVDKTLTMPLAELQKLSSSFSGTLTSTIQAIFGIILAQTLGTDDVVFGAVLSGRTVPIENPHTIVAPCITTIPQRIKVNKECSTIVDIVKIAQQGFIESLEFQHTALRHIHRWLEAEKPLFECLVSYVQKVDRKGSLYPPLWTELESSMQNEFSLTIEFEADHEAGVMHTHCTFSPAFGDLERASSLLESVDLLLGALVREENVTPEDLGFSTTFAADSRPKSHVWNESSWTPTELKIQELMVEICGISRKEVSKGASFFSLGIDSITAIRFAKSLRHSNYECSSADVLRHSCIGALAEMIEVARPHINGIANLAEQPQGNIPKHMIRKIAKVSPKDIVIEVYACTPLQSSMLTQTLGSNGVLYVHSHAVRLAQDVDLVELKQAWERLTMQTEILRTTFHFDDASNSWLAAVYQERPDAWVEYRITNPLSESLTDNTKSTIFGVEADFEQPPWKVAVLKTATEVVLVVSMHHSLYDGQSINLVFQDLARMYQGIQIPPRAPFSVAARAISKTMENAAEFWLQKLDGYHSNIISPSVAPTETDMIEVELSLKMTIDNILQGCRDLDVTIQTVAILAYGKILACVSGRRDVVFGHVVGGRSLAMPGADEVIGPLFNTVPSRIIFDKTYVANKTAAVEIQQSWGDSQPYQHASLASIMQGWRRKVGDADAQLIDTLFIFQNIVGRSAFTDGLWAPFDLGDSVAFTEYPTNFEFEQGEKDIRLKVVSRKGLRTREQLKLWLTEFDQAFQDILEQPQRSVMAFPSSLQGLPLAIESGKSRSPQQDEVEFGPDLEVIRTALSGISRVPPENISVDASIFSLGLDSISAIQVAATCRKRGYAVSVADVVQGRSLGGICRLLRERKPDQYLQIGDQVALISTESRSEALVLAKVGNECVEDVLPCLAGQVYHLATWLKSNRMMCEATWTYQCSERLNVDDMRSAWKRLRGRHSVMRTTFVAPGPKEAVQVVSKPSTLNDESFDFLEDLRNSQDIVIDHIGREAQQPFDLMNPPSKLYLVRAHTHDYLALKLHHVAYDAWTIQTIIDDLAAFYRNIDLPSPPRFDSFIQHTLNSLHKPPEEIYWRRSLNNCQQTILEPSTTLTPTASTPATLYLKSAIPNLHNLENTCRQTSTTLPTLILLAYARTLARHTRITNPTFGLYQAGRSASFKNIDQLCAPTLNVLPVVVPSVLDLPVGEIARQLQADLAARVDFEQSYLSEVLAMVGYGSGENPLFNTFVNILSDEAHTLTKSSRGNGARDEKALFVPYQLDGMGELAPTEPIRQEKTAVDGLEVGYLAEKNLFFDVVRNVEDDCVDFGIKCDGTLMDAGMVRVFAAEVAAEVARVVEAFREGRGG